MLPKWFWCWTSSALSNRKFLLKYNTFEKITRDSNEADDFVFRSLPEKRSICKIKTNECQITHTHHSQYTFFDQGGHMAFFWAIFDECDYFWKSFSRIRLRKRSRTAATTFFYEQSPQKSILNTFGEAMNFILAQKLILSSSHFLLTIRN